MALIGRIRNNSWILIVVIGLGLGGFLLMDMNSASRGPGNGMSQMIVGKVNGEKIRRTEFENVLASRYNGGTAPVYQNRNSLWTWFVEDELLRAEGENLGIGISEAEIDELEFGTNLSPIIQRNFQNPQIPGQVDRQRLNELKTMIDENTIEEKMGESRAQQFVNYWKMQREMIRKDRMQTKIQALVQKAMYTPTWMAEMGHTDQNQRVGFNYVKIPYDKVTNEEVSLSDSDLSSYLNSHKAQYERKNELRTIDYVVFDVVPTPVDSLEIRTKLEKLIPEFRQAENGDSNFVLINGGVITPTYMDKAALGATADTLMNVAVGTVYGPYEESGENRIIKVIDHITMADSANVRHILLVKRPDMTFSALSERADSIINVLQNGTAVFDTLVVNLSDDTGSTSKGGLYEDLTPNSQFGEAYDKVVFTTGTIGQLEKVKTNYGYVVLEVMSRSANTSDRLQTAYVAEPIVPSKATQDDIFQKASRFIADNRDLKSMRTAAAETEGLRVVTTPPFDHNAYELGQLGFSNETKDAICWAFSADTDDVSPSVYTFTDKTRYYDNKYVVIGLSAIQEAGMPAVHEIRDVLETAVINTKKADILKGKVTSTTLDAIASQFGVSVDTLASVTFSTPGVAGLGNEPKVIATALGMEQGQTSSIIEGQGGMFFITITNKPPVSPATNLPQIRQSLTATSRSQVARFFMPAFSEGADIEDNRSTYECN